MECPEPSIRVPDSRGFTLLELLVVIAVISILALVGLPALQQMMVRNKLEGITRQGAIHMQIARQEAIKRGVPVVVRAEFDTDELFIFANVDEDVGFNYDPDSSRPHRTVDYEVARLQLPAGNNPTAALYFWGSGDGQPEGNDAIDGFTNDGNGVQVAVFLPNGSIDESGAFRIADTRGNFFEMRVAPQATALIRTLKYHNSPPWGGSPGFFPPGRHKGTGDPLWRWY